LSVMVVTGPFVSTLMTSMETSRALVRGSRSGAVQGFEGANLRCDLPTDVLQIA
jgi:hypothetical protein